MKTGDNKPIWDYQSMAVARAASKHRCCFVGESRNPAKIVYSQELAENLTLSGVNRDSS